MKKILSGVLAAASLLTMTVSASAASNSKAVKAAGEVEYDVAVTAPKIVLDLVMPAKMSAQLNPYGAEIKMEEEATELNAAGIASVAYKITNNTVDYGIYIDATAVTTVSTSDKTAWKVTTAAPVAGTKSAQMALVAGNTLAELETATQTVPTAGKAFTDPDQGALVMDSTAAADKTKGTVAGQTSQKKFMFIKAAADEETPAEGYMAFTGALADSKADGTADVEWTEDDAINVALVLKVVAGGKGASNGVTFNAVTGATTAAVAAAAADNGISNVKLTKASTAGGTTVADEYTCDVSIGTIGAGGSGLDVRTLFNLNLDAAMTGNEAWSFAGGTTKILNNGHIATTITSGNSETATIALNNGTDYGEIKITFNFVD